MDGDPLAGGGAYFSYFVPGCFSMVFFKNASVSEQNKFRGSIVVVRSDGLGGRRAPPFWLVPGSIPA